MKVMTIVTVSFFISLLELIIASPDEQPPKITYCPADKEILIKASSIRLNWERVKASDNSNQPVLINCNYQNGVKVSAGSLLKIICNATDSSGNTATCSFTVKVSRPSCKLPASPRNGVLTCLMMNAGYLCTVSCNSKYDFAYHPQYVYFCQNGNWVSYPNLGKMPWPDCSVRFTGKPVVMSPQYYYLGDSNDPNVQAKIKGNFMTIARDPTKVPPFFCLFNRMCKIENVKVYTGVHDAAIK